ncbi:thiamine pyrophosphate-binding protein [Nocardia pseudobrasiliensis]|uniref:acetolactate synthase n=1 Tax=Nocardia pseudobrasiliensis TaxID=45979 RepID=A0A370HQ21_9NOCA|nr:thiamine pyrophosphate-binding protein [Nocardia pseudobrasiliensis]RDI60365.1 benzoylformate decarboxylase [Nocardia pseudobrasiliensis]
MPTVKQATYEVLRRFGLSTLFGNPGSTEVDFLAGLPEDLNFVLGLHESAVVGMATGHALRTERPALVLLHTTAGFGNAVGALATARVNRAPLVVLVGQQDRRHLSAEPFLTGRLHGLAGDYPVWSHQPDRAQDVPEALARAWYEARAGRGPAIVVVPMDDWHAEIDAERLPNAPARLRSGVRVEEYATAELAEMLYAAKSPCVVAGSGNDSAEGWQALVELAECLGCPVWQEPFGARAGFPQDHRRYAGHLPAGRAALRDALAGHDLVLVVGAAAFRQYAYEPGPFVAPGTTLAVVTDDPDEAHRSPAALAILADPARTVARLAKLVPARTGSEPAERHRTPVPPPAEPLAAAHVFAALAAAIPADTIVLEEAPSARAALYDLLPARHPLGLLSAAMGGLGFAMPTAIGLRLADPARPVVAVVGDGSALYCVQSVWSAVHYRVGALFVVLANGRYRIMDQLSARAGAPEPAWPGFDEIGVAAIAHGFGCPVERITDHPSLIAVFDAVLPTLPDRREPLLLEIAVTA